MMLPRTMKQRAVAELQGKSTPPNPRPRKNSSVAAVIVEALSQSMALTPAINGVFGVWTSRKNKRIVKAMPSQGTTSMIRESILFRNLEQLNIQYSERNTSASSFLSP